MAKISALFIKSDFNCQQQDEDDSLRPFVCLEELCVSATICVDPALGLLMHECPISALHPLPLFAFLLWIIVLFRSLLLARSITTTPLQWKQNQSIFLHAVNASSTSLDCKPSNGCILLWFSLVCVC